MKFVRLVAVGCDETLESLKAVLEAEAAREHHPSLTEAANAIEEVAAGAPPSRAADALDAITRADPVKVFRRELLWAIVDTLRDSDSYVGLLPRLRRRRQLTSHVGRRLARCSAGSTLLLKGMEFDHAIVVDTDNSR